MIRVVLKWFGIVLAALVVILIVYRLTAVDDNNAKVAEDIRSNPDGERARRAMLVWLPDGTMYPVNFLQEDDLVFMGIDGLWWREFQGEGARVRMLIRGEEYSGHAKAVLDDPAYKADVFSRLRPTAPEWLPDWLNGKLVVITLTES